MDIQLGVGRQTAFAVDAAWQQQRRGQGRGIFDEMPAGGWHEVFHSGSILLTAPASSKDLARRFFAD